MTLISSALSNFTAPLVLAPLDDVNGKCDVTRDVIHDAEARKK